MGQITNKTNIKAKLAITDTSQDTIIDGLVSGAIAFIENYISKSLDGDTTVERVEYFDEMPIYTSVKPTSIVSLKEWDGSAYQLVDSTQYRLLSDGSIDYAFDSGLDVIEVTYKGAEQPEELRELIERIVIRQYRKIEHEGEKSTSFSTSTTTWSNTLDAFDKAVLANYRVWI